MYKFSFNELVFVKYIEKLNDDFDKRFGCPKKVVETQLSLFKV